MGVLTGGGTSLSALCSAPFQPAHLRARSRLLVRRSFCAGREHGGTLPEQAAAPGALREEGLAYRSPIAASRTYLCHRFAEGRGTYRQRDSALRPSWQPGHGTLAQARQLRALAAPAASAVGAVEQSDVAAPVPAVEGNAGKDRAAGGGELAAVSGAAIRRVFLDFFSARGHAELPSASLVPEDPTVLLTIAGMLQFKPIFLGQEPRRVARATTAQKCIRTNDVENVGRTARHHTFFEMLGNFSFGDYFKREACAWAWELATQHYKLPAERVWISVYEDDDEALAIWRDEVGVAEERIRRMGAEDNFWTSGPTGPCGPCSEMYFDFYPELGTAPSVSLEDDSRFIEFYNLVFMQFNRTADGALEPLKNRNIDTGMGLERMAQILQKVPNNYETDLIFPIVRRAAQLAGIDYHRAGEESKRHLKVIGDHTRAVVYLISDGVVPSNVGRGYVVRRLVRRVVRAGRQLGIPGDIFVPTIAREVVALSEGLDAEVAKNASRIYEELEREEAKFVLTLGRGERLLEQLLGDAAAAASAGGAAGQAVLSGKDAFLLYDTYGFPVEITQEAAQERGVAVDMEAFEGEMSKQRKQSQAAHNAVKLALGGAVADLAAHVAPTQFVGYLDTQTDASVVALLADGKVVEAAEAGQAVDVVLDRSPFYAESGGQVGDQGRVQGAGGHLRVVDVQKGAGDLVLHRCVVHDGRVAVGDSVTAAVDSELRKRAAAHHTATHLVQAALKTVVGGQVSQAGSLVATDRLRFDFNCPRALSEDELARIEALVNGWIGQAVPLQTRVMELTAAKAAGAIAMFGEKYGDEVRVIEVPGISTELCGGTHVGNTAEIRGLKVVAEAGIAAGVRRIEAVAGAALMDYLGQRDAVVKALSSSLKVKAEEVPARVAGLQDEVRAARNEAAGLRGQLAVAKAQLLATSAAPVGPEGTRLLVAPIENVDPESLKTAAEALLEQLSDPAALVLGSASGGKVSLVVAFSPSVVKRGLQAGKFVGSIAKVCGGGGGGRPNLAQAGGRLPEKLPEALAKAKEDLVQALAG